MDNTYPLTSTIKFLEQPSFGKEKTSGQRGGSPDIACNSGFWVVTQDADTLRC
jgi:hypothetical protein